MKTVNSIWTEIVTLAMAH